MVKINNSQISNRQKEILGLKNGDFLNSEVFPISNTVIPIEPKINVYRSLQNVTALSNATMYTTPTDKDFYLTSVSMSVIGTTDSSGDIRFYDEEGNLRTFTAYVSSDGTVGRSANNTMYFGNVGIKLMKGSNISCYNGNVAFAFGMIAGYTIEVLN